MEIKLKNLHVYERMSEETNAFDADVYINGFKAAFAKNSGRGEMTDIREYGEKGRVLLAEAETYCKGLPGNIYESGEPGEKPIISTMDLETFVDVLVNDFLQQKHQAQFRKKMEKDMVQAIVFGIPDEQYRRLPLKAPLESYFKRPEDVEKVKRVIHQKVLPNLSDGEMILNTNISNEILKTLDIPSGKIVEQKLQEKKPMQTAAKKVQTNKGKKKGLK